MFSVERTAREAVATMKSAVMKFKIGKRVTTGPKRARYNFERREEVKTVRKIRACLRCSLLKLKVTLSHHEIARQTDSW